MRALIITPTRELAAQVEESVRTYGKYVGGLKSALVYGGVGMQPQIDALRRGVDILVATPGRLLDLMGQGHLRIDRLAVFDLQPVGSTPQEFSKYLAAEIAKWKKVFSDAGEKPET